MQMFSNIYLKNLLVILQQPVTHRVKSANLLEHHCGSHIYTYIYVHIHIPANAIDECFTS